MSVDILIVDDEQDIRELISDILEDEGYTTRCAKDSSSTMIALEERLPNLIILDIWLQGSELDGLGILEIIKTKYPTIPVIIISGHGNIETALNSIRLGAYDYIEKPFKEDKLLLTINRALETLRLKEENRELKQKGTPETELIGNSAAIISLKNSIIKAAPTSSRILISGPAGSGKELIARQIHKNSKRSTNPFIIFDSTRIPPNEIDNELFGTSTNSWHSSESNKIGAIERSHRGTIFIEEITDLSITSQKKLLKFLQFGKFTRVGSETKVEVDVRVISSSNKDLKSEIAQGNLIQDLYHRLNVVSLTVPSLQQRKADIPDLVKHFIDRCTKVLGLNKPEISEDTISTLQNYKWPGNVRQLKNVIEWLLIMSQENNNFVITPNLLPPEISKANKIIAESELDQDLISMPLRPARNLFEKQYLISQLNRFNCNISKTAEFIGMERSALHRKLKSLGIGEESEEQESATADS